MTEEESEKYFKAVADSLVKQFEIKTEAQILDAIIININLYKAGKANALFFSTVLGAATTAFMTKTGDKAKEEIKLHQAQPNPTAN